MQSEAYERVEVLVREGVHWAQLAVEAGGALVIALGVIVAAYAFLHSAGRGEAGGYQRVRLTLAHYLALALEFLLAADILATAVSPTWDQIGKLAAIATIRTGLNFFLQREMKAEAEEVRDRRDRHHTILPPAHGRPPDRAPEPDDPPSS